MILSPAAVRRFLAKVDKNGPVHPLLGTPCWLWTASKSEQGYGYFSVDDRMYKAHRIAWIISCGPILDEVLHRCDVPPCVNVQHLFQGSNLDNSVDKMEKGRVSRLRGESNGRHKLSEENVREIRQRYAAGAVTQTSLAASFGVSQPMIGYIVRGENWNDF